VAGFFVPKTLGMPNPNPMTLPHRLMIALSLCACAFLPQLLDQSSPYNASDQDQRDQETVVLPAFAVQSDMVDRYRATDAVSSARVRTQLIETPNSISLIVDSS